MSRFPKDRFDDPTAVPARPGSHRRHIVRRPWWALALIGLGSSAAIVLAALAGIAVIDARNLEALKLPGLGATATPTPTSTAPGTSGIDDPTTLSAKQLDAVTITVLNGTTQPSTGQDVASLLTNQGWPHVSSADASDSSIKLSVVVYSADANRSVAHGVAQALGIAAIKQSDVYPGATVTVLVGADFVH